MKVIEQHEIHVFLVNEDGTDKGLQELCCDGHASDDYLWSSSEYSEPRDATAEELAEVGARIVPKDTFWFELKQEQLVDAAG